MKRKIFILMFALVMAVSLMLVPAVASAITYDSTLLLENKDYNTWAIESGDGIYGTLDYNSSGPTFDFNFTAYGLSAGDYSLIYYADQEERFTYWGGDNPGAVIATFTAASSISSGDVSVELDMNLPCPPDANMYDHDYSGPPDYYDHAHGAKIWLVPTSVLTTGDLPVTVWPPTDDWLFETDLITYVDTDIDKVGVGTSVQEDVISLDVIPSFLGFGKVYPGDCVTGADIYIYNTGTVKIDVDAESDTFFESYLELDGDLVPSFAANDIPEGGNSGSISTELCIPHGTSAGTHTANLVFWAYKSATQP